MIRFNFIWKNSNPEFQLHKHKIESTTYSITNLYIIKNKPNVNH